MATIQEYVRILRARWWVVLAAVLVGTLAAGVYVATATREYASSAQLFVSTPTSQNLTDVSAGGTFAQDRVASYATVAVSPAILDPVAQELGLPYDGKTLRGHVAASAPLNTVIIDITATDTDPARATRIVNAVAARLSTYIGTLEMPVGSVTSPVKATVIEVANGPGAKVAPRAGLVLPVGFASGLLAGLVLAIGLARLDNRVTPAHDLEALADAPVVGLIGEDKLARSKPLILLDDAFSDRAEAFRQLRTNVRFLGVDRLLRSVVVTGSVEAEGKSLTASNLAVALAQSGERVVLVDADLRRPTIASTFGMSGSVGLSSVLAGRSTLKEALQVWREDLPLAILPAGPTPPNPSELLGSRRLQEVLADLEGGCDIVVFDSPPLLPVTDAALLARATDGALVVTRAKSTRLNQLAAALRSLRSADADILGVIVNRIPGRSGGYGMYGGYQYGGYAPRETPVALLPAPADQMHDGATATPPDAVAAAVPVEAAPPPPSGAEAGAVPAADPTPKARVSAGRPAARKPAASPRARSAKPRAAAKPAARAGQVAPQPRAPQADDADTADDAAAGVRKTVRS